MTHRQPTTRPGWWRLLLAALAALVVGLLGVTSASATTLTGAETRVGASTPATAYVVGVHESVSAGQRWGNAPPTAQIVSATGVAAESGASLSGRLVTEEADKAISLARRATPEQGYFDVIGHGTETSVSGLSPQELAAQIRSTPSWGGQNVRLLACRTGCPVSNYGQSLANELGVTVKGANVDILPQYNGFQKLAPGGSWFTYTPGG